MRASEEEDISIKRLIVKWPLLCHMSVSFTGLIQSLPSLRVVSREALAFFIPL